MGELADDHAMPLGPGAGRPWRAACSTTPPLMTVVPSRSVVRSSPSNHAGHLDTRWPLTRISYLQSARALGGGYVVRRMTGGLVVRHLSTVRTRLVNAHHIIW